MELCLPKVWVISMIYDSLLYCGAGCVTLGMVGLYLMFWLLMYSVCKTSLKDREYWCAISWFLLLVVYSGAGLIALSKVI